MNHKQTLLHKYLTKQCSPEELKQLFRYLKDEPEARYQEVMDNIWEELTSYQPLTASTSDSMYAHIRGQIDQQKTPSVFRRLWTTPALRIAATFTVLLLSVFMLYKIVESNTPQVHQTAYGQTTTVTLPDQSVVTLNGNSRIRYARAWEEDQPRELWIEGEAYFTIRHTEHDQKFIVHADRLDIEVLGTEFNVNNRDGDTRVTLNTGKIKLNDTEASPVVHDVVMRPGEQAELRRNHTFELKAVNPELFTSWKNQELIFDHTPMAQVVSMIEDTYGLEVTIQQEEIKTMELTGLLPSQDIDMLLNMLSEIFDLKVTRQHKQVFIDKK